MKQIKTLSKGNKTATINLTNDEVLTVTFVKDGMSMGEIVYSDKSYYYVEDAAYNWITNILTEETLNRYKVQ